MNPYVRIVAVIVWLKPSTGFAMVLRMRVTFYDCGTGSFAVQYLLSITASSGHHARLYFDCSLSTDYLAQDIPFTGLFSLSRERICHEILATRPDVVGFSMYSFQYRANLELIRILKRERPDLIIVCGGIHVSLTPDAALKHPEIDFVVVGEAEVSFPRLLDCLANDGVDAVRNAATHVLPGVWNRSGCGIIARGLSPVVRNLDEIPFPDKSAHIQANPALAAIYSIIGSRGCFGSCSYCNSASMNRLYRENGETYYRVRSVDNIIQELQQAIERYRPRTIAFWDDVFGVRGKWLEEFCDRYPKEIGLPFEVQANPHIHDEHNLKRLADAGCVTIDFGFQSANEEVRRTLLHRTETNEQVRQAIGWAKQNGIFVELDLIVNLPGETPAHIEEALRFLADTHPNLVNCGFLQYFPGAQITEFALENGYLKPETLEQIEQGESVQSMRLLPKDGVGIDTRALGYQYRLLPYYIFFASRLPGWLARPSSTFVGLPLVRSVCSLLAPFFLYTWRFIYSFLDRRSFFLHRQIIPFFYAIRWILKKRAESLFARGHEE